jgi:2'-5' RNA ligase
MLITHTDKSLRQGTLWREQRPQQAQNLSRPPNAVFFVVQPDLDIARQLGWLARSLRDKHKLKGRLRPEWCFHVTLHGIGDYTALPRDGVAAIGEAVSEVTMSPFTVAFNRVTNFGRGPDRALVLVGDDGVAGLRRFRHELVTALRKIGFARRREPHYEPHLTLLYHEGEIADQPVEEVRWTVCEFVLVRSLYGQSRHLPLARWLLG